MRLWAYSSISQVLMSKSSIFWSRRARNGVLTRVYLGERLNRLVTGVVMDARGICAAPST